MIKGFYQGFKIPYTGKECQIISSNHKSARENFTILQQKIEKEITAGRVEGPFQKPPSDIFKVSPLGLVPKKTSGDHSYPTGNSVNEGIPEMHRTVSYQSIDDAVRIVIQLGRKSLLSKVDIEHAYKIIPINPASFHLLSFVIGDKYFFDKTLPMGLSYSCNLFEQFSCAIHWIAENKLGILGCVHVIYDFLFISPPDYKQASENLYKFLKFADKLGLPIKDEKQLYQLLS